MQTNFYQSELILLVHISHHQQIIKSMELDTITLRMIYIDMCTSSIYYLCFTNYLKVTF